MQTYWHLSASASIYSFADIFGLTDIPHTKPDNQPKAFGNLVAVFKFGWDFGLKKKCQYINHTMKPIVTLRLLHLLINM